MPSTNPFVVETIPEIRSKIVAGKNWKELAEIQKIAYFSHNDEQ